MFVAPQKNEAYCAWGIWCDMYRDIYFHAGTTGISIDTTSVFPGQDAETICPDFLLSKPRL